MPRRKRVKPLFYIDQPELENSNNNMQNRYRFMEGQSDENNIDKEKESLVEESAEDMEANAEGKKKPFNTLSVSEKIEYLNQFPVSIVKILYTFITKDKKTVGYFVSASKDSIKVLPLNKRKHAVILIEEIE